VIVAALQVVSACDGSYGVATGDGGDSRAPANPTTPVTYAADIPADLWRAPPDARATPGNYVYLDSAAVSVLLFTDDMSLTRVTRNAGTVTVSVSGADPRIGVFIGAPAMRDLQMGYYYNAMGLPFRSPAAYRLFAQLAGCATPRGWFAVDSVRYAFDNVVALDLRFEQRCDDSGVMQHGQVHWRG
jgi:hypothetical protein